MKKLLLILPLAFLINQSFAIICPTLAQLKANQLGQWHAFDLDGGDPLCLKQLIKFEQQAKSFREAAYYVNAPEGPGQCYYAGSGSHQYLSGYLAREHIKPLPGDTRWHQENVSMWDCAAGVTNCLFTAGDNSKENII